MTSANGKIIATGRCTHGIWNVEVAKEHKIRLSFTYFNLFENKQLVHVRDGESPSDDLLFSSDGNKPSSDVISSSNYMYIELISLVAPASTNSSSLSPLAIFQFNATLPIHVHGFIASYSSTGEFVYHHVYCKYWWFCSVDHKVTDYKQCECIPNKWCSIVY